MEDTPPTDLSRWIDGGPKVRRGLSETCGRHRVGGGWNDETVDWPATQDLQGDPGLGEDPGDGEGGGQEIGDWKKES